MSDTLPNDRGHSRKLVVVDAANVVGSVPDGWWRDRAGAATRLIARIRTRLADTAPDIELVVVLEGAAKSVAEQKTDPAGILRLIAADGSGDDAIVRVVAAVTHEHPERPVTVVTADRGLRARVEPLGAVTIGPGRLLDWLDPR